MLVKPQELTPAQSRNKELNELFLVEGNSAGGTAKNGRDKKFQAILPLRGKVLNCEKSNDAEIFKNEELTQITHAIGAGIGENFEADESNYNKVIIMTDADDDGAHIQVLLLTFFYRFMRPLIDAGKLFIAMPPLYQIKYGKNTEYLWTNEELDTFREKTKFTYEVGRFKGLGEMDAEQLWVTTMNPLTRSIIKVSITDAALAEKRVRTLMGENVEIRKEWIEENVEFSLEDNWGKNK